MMRFDSRRAAHVLFGSPRSGAAGGSILNAELAHAKGYLR